MLYLPPQTIHIYSTYTNGLWKSRWSRLLHLSHTVGRFCAVVHSSHEPGELWQWLCDDDSTINTVLCIIIIVISAAAVVTTRRTGLF